MWKLMMTEDHASLMLRKKYEENNNVLSGDTCSSQEELNKVNCALNLRNLNGKSEVKLPEEDDEDLKGQNTPGRISECSFSDSDASSLISSPRTPHSMQNFSMPISESLEGPDLAKVQPMSAHPEPDVTRMGRRGSSKSRRTGFAFRFGDHAVPANAFVNIEEEPEAPKMLSVTEMMMKLNSDSKSQSGIVSQRIPRKPSRSCSWDSGSKIGGSEMCSDRLSAPRFSLIGMRQMSSTEIEEELKFLHFKDEDKGLDLSLFEKISLIWYEKGGRFAAGLVVGVFLAIVFRITLALYLFVFGSW